VAAFLQRWNDQAQRMPHNPKPQLLVLAMIFIGVLMAHRPAVHAQDPPRPTFRAGVALVPITALVRDSHNRIVRNLARDDFQVLERGTPRPIVEFKARNDAPVSVALVFDTSGSMSVASNVKKGREFVNQFLNQMDPALDEAALFTFHRVLRQEVPFTSDRRRIRSALDRVKPWGLTSLYDAVGQTAKRLAARPSRRAIIVVSDGVDTSSALTPPQVAAIASGIDVPVYVIAVLSPLDQPADGAPVAAETVSGGLADLAYRTGGDLLYVNAPDQAQLITMQLLEALRQQYFLAIESSTAPGWYPLEVRTKQGLTVRARSGYQAA
jgi:VWFA-related protein